MNIFTKIYQRAKKNPKKIVLPEGNEPRVIEAAVSAAKQGLAHIIVLGKGGIVLKKARGKKSDIKKIEIVNPQADKDLDDYIKSYWQLRKHRGVTEASARDLFINDFIYFAAMMVRKGRAHSFIAGASHTTSDVARACLRCIEKDPRYSTASGSFLIKLRERRLGEGGLFLFADCGIVPEPQAKQLADIAQTSAELWTKVTGYRPRLAMLSFSTKGSGTSISVEKVKEATEMVRKLRPDLTIDGELQADSAIEPSVARIKAPGSPLKGRANILIFPNLDAGNIAYKLMQRLARARVVGPLIQGLSRPCSDLSRGCGPEEIVDAIAVATVRAQD